MHFVAFAVLGVSRLVVEVVRVFFYELTRRVVHSRPVGSNA